MAVYRPKVVQHLEDASMSMQVAYAFKDGTMRNGRYDHGVTRAAHGSFLPSDWAYNVLSTPGAGLVVSGDYNS